MKKHYFLWLWILLPLLLEAEAVSLLTRTDIPTILEQMTSQHLGKKHVEGTLVEKSLKEYIEQFDPEKIYLLNSEVQPFIKVSAGREEKLGKEYSSSNFSTYEQLDKLFQKAIFRAQKVREKLALNPEALIEKARHWKGDLPSYKNFADNENELRKREEDFLVFFMKEELNRFGEKNLIGHEKQAIALFEKHARSFENKYLYLNSEGVAMTQDQKENEFSLRVIKALAKSLDPHSAYLDPHEADEMRSRLEKGFEGVGIVFQETPQGIEIAKIVEGGPAEKEGTLKPGDRLESVNGESTKAKGIESSLKKIKEASNKTVKFVFTRPASGEKLELSLKKAPIALNEGRVTAYFEPYKDGILAVLELNTFYQNDQGITSEADMVKALEALRKQGYLKGIILDLRENSGGFLSQAVKVAGLFITNGVVVVAKYSDGNEKIYRDIDSRQAFDGPLIVLTSKITASAAEIVAGALQDYGVALVVGDTHTYGKGTIQSQNVTDNIKGPSFKVTIGEYYTVSGKTPQIDGVLADIVVPGPYADVEIGEAYLDGTVHEEDHIEPNFKDALKDVNLASKPWFDHYYLPSLQPRSAFWKKAESTLKANSTARLAKRRNPNFILEKVDWLSKERTVTPAPFQDDLQLQEALAILQDMVEYQGTLRQKEYLRTGN